MFSWGHWAEDNVGSIEKMNSCLLGTGLKAEFPAAASYKGMIAMATDEGNRLYYSDGAAWVKLPLTVSSSGQYTGNAAGNRAIPHGLAVTPAIVFIVTDSGSYFFRIFGIYARIFCTGTADSYRDVTIPNATNFYVGNAGSLPQSANASATIYFWSAIG